MSLINDVLKDLERRDAPEATQTPRSVENRRSGSAKRTWRWPLWLIAALAVGIVLHLSLNPGSPSNVSEETGPLIAQAEPPDKPEPAAAVDHGLPNEPTEAPAKSEPVASAAPAVETALAASEPLEHSSERQSAEREPRPQTERAPDPAPASPSRPEPEPARQDSQREEPAISIRRSNESPDTPDSLAAAKRFLARGQFQRAESRLRQLIDEQPALTEAHELLANALIRQRQHDSAIRVLETGLREAQNPSPLAALLGRLLMERGELARAGTVLQEHAPALADAPDYHLLLAAVHRQAGNHEAAAEHYRKLTGILPRRGAAWIGLGTSLESLERQEEALEAYSRALEGDDARAARFARQRLNALESMTGEPQ
ncbi:MULTISPECIES: tetratricopeptide repeat protein [unclassified Wenzhouxiangella]|uniref:tetratricopeptide repeat protein n=1 Tax=unclassified Wenzhouxiangella TaxID=2613841 RepID=UPI000E32C0A3|nr:MULTISPECIES: tetratricopeptide repeat protein [unclassified Wenzhouxiangella]RFF28288.1 hypothetical protein DZK25_03305 [Wenzhouxiangella sp. 15181]RFP67787.1 hypothetical protein DZK26_11330 [Wenzhouxiangella sp. 15190]